jgi:hypothetical protein
MMVTEPKFKSVSLKIDLYNELEEIRKEIQAETDIEGLKIPDVIRKLKAEYRNNHAKA